MSLRPSVYARIVAAGAGVPYAAVRRFGPTAVVGGPFRVVVADPPWAFEDSLPGASRGAAKNYDLLDAELVSRDFVGGELLDRVADDAYLFLWRVAAGSKISAPTLLERAYQVARAWGFAPKTEGIWAKQTKNGARHFGMGHHHRMEHEGWIVATRGKPEPLNRNVRSVLHAPAPSGPNGRTIHSAKPEEFYRDYVERLSRGPYLELFGRRARPGWTVAGKEMA
jgi:N6-adenosine-specific RNA methylase IME4